MATDEQGEVDYLQRTRQTSPRARARLIWAFAVRDLRARFTATSLGLIWALVVPLATVLIYSTVFAVIFRAQAPPMGNGHDGVFAVWFFCGLVTCGTSSRIATGGRLNRQHGPDASEGVHPLLRASVASASH